MPYAVISGTGHYVPEKVVTNDDLRRYYDTSDEWIYERSGIKERRFAEEGTGPADLAVPAVEQALARAGVDKSQIEMIIFATLSPECWFPGSGCFLQEKMNFPNIPALDIRMQCSGFVYGLSIAEQYIKTGMYRRMLVVGSEVQSTSLDLSPEGRTVGVLFGDGAGAAVIEASQTGPGIVSTHLHSQGRYARELWVPEPTSCRRPKVGFDPKGLYPYMNGREVFKHAVTRMKEAALEAVHAAGWTLDEVDWYFVHQANYRIAAAIADDLGVSMDKFYMTIHKYGNTTAASIPISLSEAQADGSLKKGHKIVVTAFGSGFTWGSAAVVW
ncbi:MAG: ketoacyl-ACP synthase III [Bacteroidia bacterium]|nr:ketoacyl-ACP synthase III [Bacteroidia bacterium]